MLEPVRRYLAVVSPRAGEFRPAVCRLLETEFRRVGHRLEFHFLETLPGLQTAVDRAIESGCRDFLAVGGDGTVSRLASCLYGKPHALGIIPVGTANTLARVLGISLNPTRAARIAVARRTVTAVDGLIVGEQLCLLNVSAGVSSMSLDGLDAAQKAAAGMFSYVIGAAKATLKVAPCDYQLTIDGQSSTIRGVEMHVTNVGVIGVPQFHLYDKSILADGQVEVLGITHWTPRNIVNTALDIVLRRKRRALRFIGTAGVSITIDCAQPMPVQGDGDIIGTTPVTIRIAPQAVNFILP
jgi:diacylglycerol kinase family enzyme